LIKDNKYLEIKGYWREDAKLKFNIFKSIYSNINIEIWDKEKLKKKIKYIMNYLLIILDYSTTELSINPISKYIASDSERTERKLRKLGYKESQCHWMICKESEFTILNNSNKNL